MPNVFLTTFFFWLVCAESLVTSVIDLSGNLSKSTSGPFSNIAAQRMITWRGSCTTRYEDPAATPLLMTPFSRRLNSSEMLWFSQTIKARRLEKKKKKWKERKREPLKCIWCIIHHREKCASWGWRESTKNWKQTFDVSRPESSIFPRCQTPALAQRQILSGEFPALQLLCALH